MKQLRLLRRSTWNWLPVFLSVAETGSASEASRDLGISPAAVSRTLRLLEDHLGRPLFTRSGRTLRLNSAGMQMRASIRAAVDEIDMGLRAFQPEPFDGILRVSAQGAINEHFVLPALLELRREHSTFQPEQLILTDKEVARALPLGDLDVVFGDQPVEGEGLHNEVVGSYAISVYCGRTHPLYGVDGQMREQLAQYLFCAPPASPEQARMRDSWPSAWPRRIGMRVTLLASAIQVVRAGEMLAVLPDVAVLAERQRGDLHRLRMPELPKVKVYCSTAERYRARAAIQQVRARVRQRLLAAQERPIAMAAAQPAE